MRWVPKKLLSSSLVILFALAVLCASLASPAQAFASPMSDCSQPDSASEHPCQPLLCNLAAAHKLLFQDVLVPTKSDGSGKGAPFLIGNILTILSPNDILLAAKGFPTTRINYRPEKVSLHLFNSVLTL